jgi:hypothetical protein
MGPEDNPGCNRHTDSKTHTSDANNSDPVDANPRANRVNPETHKWHIHAVSDAKTSDPVGANPRTNRGNPDPHEWLIRASLQRALC